MFKLILTYLNKRNSNLHLNQQRAQAIQMSNVLGFLNNLTIFIIKFSIGVQINSIALISDAINNLSDLLSVSIALISVHLAHKPADKEHPEGLNKPPLETYDLSKVCHVMTTLQHNRNNSMPSKRCLLST